MMQSAKENKHKLPMYSCQITIWHNCWWLVVDADFETCGTPVHEVDGSLLFHLGDGGVDIPACEVYIVYFLFLTFLQIWLWHVDFYLFQQIAFGR